MVSCYTALCPFEYFQVPTVSWVHSKCTHVRWGVSSLWELIVSVVHQGPWLQGRLETRWGPAARREGPAGYKGEEGTGETAPRHPTPAGDPGWWPGNDSEFKVASNIYTQTTKKKKKLVCMLSLSFWAMLLLIWPLSAFSYTCDKIVQAQSSFLLFLVWFEGTMESHFAFIPNSIGSGFS